jgi:hypothetical protein
VGVVTAAQVCSLVLNTLQTRSAPANDGSHVAEFFFRARSQWSSSRDEPLASQLLRMKYMTKGATLSKKSGAAEAVNKAQLIRDALKKLGIDAPAKDIQAECEAHHATVAPAQISNIRTKMKEKGTGKSGRKGSGGGVSATADELIEVRTMAEKIGGVDRARALLDILDRLR